MYARRFLGPSDLGFEHGILPDLQIQSLAEIDFNNLLQERGIRGWVFDMDGTLAPRLKEHEYVLSESEARILEEIVGYPDLEAVIGTDRYSYESKVRLPKSNILKQLKVFYGDKARKPSIKFYEPIIDWFGEKGIESNQIATVGDRYDTDIKGAAELGMYTIIVARLFPEASEGGLALPYGAMPEMPTYSK